MHNRKIEKARRDRLSELVQNADKAERIRFFLRRLKWATMNDPELAPKVRELAAWAEGYLRRLDPIAYAPQRVFNVVEEPVPPPTTMEVIRYIA